MGPKGAPFGARRGNASWLCLAHRVVIRLTFVPKLLTKANPEAAVGAAQPSDVGQMGQFGQAAREEQAKAGPGAGREVPGQGADAKTKGPRRAVGNQGFAAALPAKGLGSVPADFGGGVVIGAVVARLKAPPPDNFSGCLVRSSGEHPPRGQPGRMARRKWANGYR